LVLAALAVWAARARRAGQVGDLLGGAALTGIAGCLVSPVTWVHHLVWTLPALLLLFDRALGAGGWRRWTRLAWCAALYALLSSRLVWGYSDHFTGIGVLMSNLYVLASALLLVTLPIGGQPVRASGDEPGVADLGQLDDRPVGPSDRVPGRRAVQREAGRL